MRSDDLPDDLLAESESALFLSLLLLLRLRLRRGLEAARQSLEEQVGRELPEVQAQIDRLFDVPHSFPALPPARDELPAALQQSTQLQIPRCSTAVAMIRWLKP